MVAAIRNLWLSPDMPGDFLVMPSKRFVHFVEPVIKNANGWTKTALKVVAFIVAIPIFALASIGMWYKVFDVNEIRLHNIRVKTTLAVLYEKVRKEPQFCDKLEVARLSFASADMLPIKTISLRKANAEKGLEELLDVIDECTATYQKVYARVTVQPKNQPDRSFMIKYKVELRRKPNFAPLSIPFLNEMFPVKSRVLYDQQNV